jgi:hypothetical protein
MPRYKNLGEYIRTRAAELGYNTNSLIEALNEKSKSKGVTFGLSYINSIVNGQFSPSKERCHLIADFFGDDPNIILHLAGYYSPPKDTELVEAVAGATSQLPPPAQHLLIAFANLMRDYFGPACGDAENHACLMLPTGEVLTLEIPPRVSAKMIQTTLNSALSKLAKK